MGAALGKPVVVVTCLVALALVGCSERGGESAGRASATSEATASVAPQDVLGSFRAEFARQFEAAGATSEEAECMASALLSVDPENLRLYGTTARKAKIAIALFRDHAGKCSPPARLGELARAWVMGPQSEMLAEAGATASELECFVTRVGSLDLFLPSPDFNGPTAAGLGTQRIVEQMEGCIPEPRIREIVARAFDNYIEGCTKTSEDPLAPYDC